MGDRCHMWVTVRNSQMEKFEQFLSRRDADIVEEGDFVTTLTFEQANYGCGEDLSQAAAAGCEFYGSHSAGSSYECADFHTSGRDALYVYTGMDGCGILVDGSSPSARLEHLQRCERMIVERDELIARMSNPVYDLIKESA